MGWIMGDGGMVVDLGGDHRGEATLLVAQVDPVGQSTSDAQNAAASDRFDATFLALYLPSRRTAVSTYYSEITVRKTGSAYQ